MIAPRLRLGDVVGIASPSCLAEKDDMDKITAALVRDGFRVKLADRVYNRDWGFAASPEARAADLNQLIRDPEVRLIFCNGGENAEAVLPLLDFDAIARDPKLWLSFSDGTTLTNAVWSRTGLITYYGQIPYTYTLGNPYDAEQFRAHMLEGNVKQHKPITQWYPLTPGRATGTLVGGFLDNFVFLANNGWLDPEPNRDYILLIEDNICFWGVEHESALLTRLELSPIMRQARGLLFGHFSTPVNESLLHRLTVLGQTWHIPVAYCDDFGHGDNHAIFPIGATAALDTDACTLKYE